MKIERINANQIRCTLTSADLSSRQIKLSELAYGSSKARRLFQDMMQQAHYEVGFDTDNSPLMIEAIPVSTDSIVLIITKVEDPEELDARFSRFTRSENNTSVKSTSPTGADEILELFQKIHDAQMQKKNASSEAEKKTDADQQNGTVSDTQKNTASEQENVPVHLICSYIFHTLDEVIQAAHGLNGCYHGENTLYKTKDASSPYRLILHQSTHTPELFNKICNILSEYGSSSRCSASMEACLEEQNCALIKAEALQKLADL